MDVGRLETEREREEKQARFHSGSLRQIPLTFMSYFLKFWTFMATEIMSPYIKDEALLCVFLQETLMLLRQKVLQIVMKAAAAAGDGGGH